MEKKYFAFISYKSEDVEWAIWLQHELEHYHLPALYNGREDIRQDLRPVFRDLDELSAGNLPDQIQEALMNSQNLIVVCSPKAANSPWVNQEVETFISLDRTNCIFPFIVEGNSPKEFFPPALLELPKDQERLGGEVAKNGRDAAFVKIVAGMLHVDFDSLWNRYEKEKAEQERIEREKRDNLLKVQSRYISEKARALVDKDETLLAKKMLLEVLPKDLNNPDRPYTPDADSALRYACGHSDMVLKGHTEVVRCAVFTPDGKKIISGDDDNRFRIWDAYTGQQLQLVHAHSDRINSISVSPDGKRFATGSQDRTIGIWSTETGESLLKIDKIVHKINSVAISGDGKRVATFSADKNIRVWNVETGEILWAHNEEAGWLSSLLFSKDGRRIASVSSDAIHVWDTENGTEICMISDDTSGYYRTLFTPNGRRIISALKDSSIRMWDAETGRELKRFEGPTKEEDIKSIAISPDGERLISSTSFYDSNTTSTKSSLYVWDVKNGTLLRKRHSEFIRSLCFSPNGKYIAAETAENKIRIWDAITGKGISTIEGEGDFYPIVFSPDGERITAFTYYDYSHYLRQWDVTTGMEIASKITILKNCHISTNGKYAVFVEDFHDNKIRICNTEKLDRIDFSNCAVLSTGFQSSEAPMMERSITINKGLSGPVESVAFSPDGKRIVSGDYKFIRIWDAETGKEIIKSEAHNNYVKSVAFSPCGKRIVSASSDRTIRIWDAETLAERMVIQGGEYDFSYVTFSPDGKWIVSDWDVENIRIWDAETGEKIKSYQGKDEVTSVAFSPNGKQLLASYWDKTVRLWDVETGEVVRILKGHTDVIDYAAFSPDGKRIVSASRDKTVRIWNINADCPLSFHTNDWLFTSASFSSDGTRVASSSSDGKIRIYDIKKQEEVLRLTGHSDYVNWVAYSPNGQRIVSASRDKTVRIWDAETGEEIRRWNRHSSDVFFAAYSPNGKQIISAAYDDENTAYIWDAETGKVIKKIKDVLLRPNERCVIGSLMNDTIQIWDTDTGKSICKLHWELQSIEKATAFSPDRSIFAVVTGSNDENILIIDAKNGTERARLDGHSKKVNDLTFSPDGRYILSSSDDCSIRVWDAETGQEIAVFKGQDRILTARFDKTGKHIISTSWDSSLQIWNFPSLQTLISTVTEQLKNAPLSPEERKKYYLD